MTRFRNAYDSCPLLASIEIKFSNYPYLVNINTYSTNIKIKLPFPIISSRRCGERKIVESLKISKIHRI